MTVNRTTLLDLPLPVTGTESGTWGDTTNNGLSQYMDIAIAGMNSLTSANFTAGALTLANTLGDSSATNIAAGSAQYATIRVSSLAVNSTITAPGSNRSYRIINADATYSLTIKASGQTGVTFLPGQTGVVAFNGTDYVIVGVVGAGTATDNAIVRFDGTTGEIIQNSGVTIDDSNNVSGIAQLNITTLDATNIEVTNIKAKDGTAAASIADSTGVISITSNPVLSGGTANGVLYLNGSKVATSGSALVFDGTNFATTGTATATKLIPTGNVLTGNGLHLPAANSVAITTNGANAIYIDSSQNVGIGTSSPGAKLEVSGGDSLLRGGKFIIGPTAGGNGAGAIRGTLNGVLGSLIFQTENSSAVLTDVMTLDSSGNLGLGVTPSAWGSGRSAIDMGANAYVGGTSLAHLTNNVFFNGTNFIYKATAAAGMYQIGSAHAWFTAPSGTAGNTISFTQALTLDASGNLGIGTSSPAYKLDVLIGAGSGSLFRAGQSGVSNGYTITSDGTALTHFWATTGEAMRLDTSGNLGLGGSAARATTAGSAIFNIFNGTAPVGTLTNGISLYSSSGEAYVMDAAGNATLFSPHDRDTNEWIFRSKHTPSGKVLKIDVERLLRFVNDHFGLDAVQEFIEP